MVPVDMTLKQKIKVQPMSMTGHGKDLDQFCICLSAKYDDIFESANNIGNFNRSTNIRS